MKVGQGHPHLPKQGWSAGDRGQQPFPECFFLSKLTKLQQSRECLSWALVTARSGNRAGGRAGCLPSTMGPCTNPVSLYCHGGTRSPRW